MGNGKELLLKTRRKVCLCRCFSSTPSSYEKIPPENVDRICAININWNFIYPGKGSPREKRSTSWMIIYGTFQARYLETVFLTRFHIFFPKKLFMFRVAVGRTEMLYAELTRNLKKMNNFNMCTLTCTLKQLHKLACLACISLSLKIKNIFTFYYSRTLK